MLHLAASKRYRAGEEKEVCPALYGILKGEKPSKVLSRFTPILASQLMYGARIKDWAWVARVELQMHESIKALLTDGVLVDAISILNRLPRCLSPWKRAAQRHLLATIETLDIGAKLGLISNKWNWTRANRQMKQTESMSRAQFSYTTGELYEAALMTTKLVLGVFLMTCATQTAATNKAAAELQEVVGSDRLPSFGDLGCLPYLTAYLKDVLRWRPAAPLVGPHVVAK